MDIFDRLGNLIRTILDDDSADASYGSSSMAGAARSSDPDIREAWEELESYMSEDAPPAGQTRRAGNQASGGGHPEALRKDFRNLEVPFGAPLTEVRKSYKRLMTAFHPDRHSADPDRFRTATEVTKKLNQSFERIEAHYEARG